jgi:hypothetical protein
LPGLLTESQLKGGGAFRHGNSCKRWYKKSQQNGSGVCTAKSLIVGVDDVLALIPLTRFPGFVWIIAAGFALPKSVGREDK